jgi:hypothetical protein
LRKKALFSGLLSKARKTRRSELKRLSKDILATDLLQEDSGVSGSNVMYIELES